MKELSRKFSADESDTPDSSGRLIPQPVRDSRPAYLDLRFVVKESFNLGARVFGELDRVLKIFKEGESEKKLENKEGEEKANDPS
jgi:hypothetical protein